MPGVEVSRVDQLIYPMTIKMIIFDLDGTLIDSSVDISHAINYATEGTGISPVTVQETITLIGEGISRLFEKLIEKEKIAADKELLVARFMEHYSAHLMDNTNLYPGVKEALESLAGYRKVVITNKRQGASAKILDVLGIAKYFDLIVGSDTTPERKPSPVPIHYALSMFDIKPGDAVIVGDSNFDVEAGKAAGIGTIAVTYGYRPRSALQDADYIMDSISDLAKTIDRY
jgi:phosphoglycolate phosphatase